MEKYGDPKKGQLVRSSDALYWLDRSTVERDPETRSRLEHRAGLTRLLGNINEANRHHLGRPKGSKPVPADEPALDYMDKVSAETGETKPYKLARLASEAGYSDPKVTADSYRSRLAIAWQERHKIPN